MTSAARKLPELPVLMTVDEFLAWPGDGTGTVYDLVDGVLRAQAAPSDAHGRIHSNVTYLLVAHLRVHLPSCSAVIGAGVKPRLAADWNFRIPDLIVTCARNEKGVHDVPDPVIVIEILSPSNKAETLDNVRNYATIPSVSEIVIIHSDRIQADVLVRDGKGHWPANPLVVKDLGVVGLDSITYDMPLRQAYQGTYLDDTTAV
jgi:Uma2 family endonuclease